MECMSYVDLSDSKEPGVLLMAVRFRGVQGGA